MKNFSWRWRIGSRGGLVAVALTLGAGATAVLVASSASLRARIAVLDANVTGGWLRAWKDGRIAPARIPEAVSPVAEGAYDWLGATAFMAIGHALGPSIGTGRNSLPTLEKGVRMGFRVFEVDITVTKDGELVCYHGEEREDLDELTFRKYVERIRGEGLEPCRLRDLVELARLRPDLHFILDVKNRYEEAYRLARQVIGDAGTGRQFIPQIYEFRQLEAFRKAPFFAGEVFTSYRSGLSTADIFTVARRLEVKAVTLTVERYLGLGGKVPRDVTVFVHPVNDPFDAEKMKRAGVRGIYTSYILPLITPELFQTADGLESAGR